MFCKVGLPKTFISMKNIRNYNLFCNVGLPKASKSIKNIWNYNAFDDLACLRPTMRSPGAPQETPKASQDPFKPPTLYIETPDQPQSGRYLYDMVYLVCVCAGFRLCNMRSLVCLVSGISSVLCAGSGLSYVPDLGCLICAGFSLSYVQDFVCLMCGI